MRKSCKECIHIRVCSDTVTAADDCEDYISKDDITPMKHGHWISLRESEITGFNSEFAGRDPIGGYQCSNCKEEAILDCNDEFVLSNYCPNCGTRMDKVEKRNS